MSRLTEGHGALCLRCAGLERPGKSRGGHSTMLALSCSGLLKKALTSSEASIPLSMVPNKLSFNLRLAFLNDRNIPYPLTNSVVPRTRHSSAFCSDPKRSGHIFLDSSLPKYGAGWRECSALCDSYRYHSVLKIKAVILLWTTK